MERLVPDAPPLQHTTEKGQSHIDYSGTGIDDERLAHQIQVIEQALARHAPNPGDSLNVLMKVGGLEIAGLVGVIIAAASRRVPAVIDGFISGTAALVAVELNPLIREYLLAGHAPVILATRAYDALNWVCLGEAHPHERVGECGIVPFIVQGCDIIPVWKTAFNDSTRV